MAGAITKIEELHPSKRDKDLLSRVCAEEHEGVAVLNIYSGSMERFKKNKSEILL